MIVVKSNGKIANHLYIVFELTTTATDVAAEALARWVAVHVGKQWPRGSIVEFPHAVVAGTKDSDYVDSEGEPPQNRVVAIVKQMSDPDEYRIHSVVDPDNLIVTEEKCMAPPILDPNTLCERLSQSTAPVAISGIGISGICKAFAQEVWAEIVTVERTWMDGAGGGFTEHPMWFHSEQNGAQSIHEMSYNFWGTEMSNRFFTDR